MFRQSIFAIAICCCLANLVAAQSSPCDVVKCGYGAECQVVNGRAKCVCPSFCPQYILPICGSDGKTYGNSCFMKVAACDEKKNVYEVSQGKCPGDGQGTTVKPLPTVISPGIPQPNCD